MPDAHPHRWFVALTELADVTEYTGGIGRTYAALLPALARAGVELDVLLLPRVPSDPARLAALPFRVSERVPPSLPVIGQVLRAARTRSAHRAANASAVLLPEWEGLGAFLPSTPLVTNLSTSLQLIGEVTGTVPPRRAVRRRLSYALQTWLETRQIRRSTGLIGISRSIVDWNRGRLGALAPDVVVRNCVDVDRIRSAALQASPPAAWPEGRVITFLGRLERRKGIHAALAAFNQIARTRPDVSFALVGGLGDPAKEPTREDVLRAVDPEFRDRVHVLGHVGGPALYAALRASELVMCPSLWEGFGNVALEVKAAGSALVATSGSGFAEFCETEVDSLLVAPDDAAALAEACGRILDDPALRTRLVSTAQAGVDRFSPDAVAADFVRAVDALVSHTPGVPAAVRAEG